MPTWVSRCGNQVILQTMNEYHAHDTISTIWENIELSHLAYLQEDQNPMKLEKKKRLEALIKAYLVAVPPQKKFLFPITRQVLHDSIQVNEDFSCYKTASAWHGIATYAHNLLTQPWRKEFRIIKLFNGFYKHNIETSLIGGDLMLELMGYSKIKDTLLLFEDPVDPDRVAGVSKDSLIASVECQIMLSIYAEVFKTFKDIKWMDIFLYRESYCGTVEEAVAALKHHRSPYGYNYHNSGPYYTPSVYTIPQPVSYVIPPHQLDPYQLENHQCMANHDNPRLTTTACSSQYMTSCPTGQLIEYDTALQHHQQQQPHQSAPPVIMSQQHLASSSQQHVASSSQQHRRSSSDHAVSSNNGAGADFSRRPSYSYRVAGITSPWDMDLWRTCSQEYVDQDLPVNTDPQNLSYFQKESTSTSCVNREEKPQTKEELKSKKKISKSGIDQLDQSFKELWKDVNAVPEPKPPTQSLRKKKKYRRISSTMAHFEPNRSHMVAREQDRAALPSTHKVNLDSTNGESDLSKEGNGDSNWGCKYCTYLNTPLKEVCEMCGKSKNTEAEVPLASGGRQCPQCTLVNKRGAVKCDACDTSLKDSPTYI